VMFPPGSHLCSLASVLETPHLGQYFILGSLRFPSRRPYSPASLEMKL
jgi:hypothetical protein